MDKRCVFYLILKCSENKYFDILRNCRSEHMPFDTTTSILLLHRFGFSQELFMWGAASVAQAKCLGKEEIICILEGSTRDFLLYLHYIREILKKKVGIMENKLS